MNRRLCVWFAALGMGLGGSLAFGQAGPTTNPDAVMHRKENVVLSILQKHFRVEFLAGFLSYLRGEGCPGKCHVWHSEDNLQLLGFCVSRVR